MMKNIFIFSIEPVETRYTHQWITAVENAFSRTAYQRKYFKAHTVSGLTTSNVTTEGAFLDFATTNIWKNEQINIFLQQLDKVQPGDAVLFCDFWHSGAIQIKYISDLLDLNLEIYGIAHAGAYDKNDFLGRIPDTTWALAFEKSLAHVYDTIFVATEYHKQLFMANVTQDVDIVVSGQPHGGLRSQIRRHPKQTKRDMIIFPHRLAPEKQSWMFRDLAEAMPQYEWVITTETNLPKDEYYNLMGQAKIMFSANLQETLGISTMEAVLMDTIPFVPNRLSYSEMYLPVFKYPSEWTLGEYHHSRDKIIERIDKLIKKYYYYRDQLGFQKNLLDQYLNPDVMVKHIQGRS